MGRDSLFSLCPECSSAIVCGQAKQCRKAGDNSLIQCGYPNCRNHGVEHVETYPSGVTEFFCRVCKRYFSRRVKS
jgi:hypothetical protein